MTDKQFVIRRHQDRLFWSAADPDEWAGSWVESLDEATIYDEPRFAHSALFEPVEVEVLKKVTLK